ncbi:MAG TPA: hypothetical protein VJ861_03175 [Treponemataceae bacterium]|nr:hypothetical protein [Treponemataceae bacterium]
MSDFNEGSRRRDRHRKNKGRDVRPGDASTGSLGQQSLSGTPSRQKNVVKTPPRARELPRERKEELPPLPKLPTPLCIKCGLPIQDITSALSDKKNKEAMHFDCVLEFLRNSENIEDGQKIAYIGQGRFAVIVYENPQDTKTFKIVRIIEWEGREAKAQWREDIADRFSQVR